MAKVLTLDDVDLEGRTVLVRVDINSPMDPETNVFLMILGSRESFLH